MNCVKPSPTCRPVFFNTASHSDSWWTLHYFNYPICFHLSDHKACGFSASKDHQVVTAIEYQGRVPCSFSSAVLFEDLMGMTCMSCLSETQLTPAPLLKRCSLLLLPWELFLHLLSGNFGHSMKGLMYKEGLLFAAKKKNLICKTGRWKSCKVARLARFSQWKLTLQTPHCVFKITLI